MDKKLSNCLVKPFRKNGCTQSVNVNYSTVARYLKANGIEYFKKVKVPEKKLP